MDLPLISIDPMGIRYGSSKLFQILMPLSAYVLIRDVLINSLLLRKPFQEKLVNLMPDTPFWTQFKTNLPMVFEQILGVTSWKIGCDFGFFLIVTAQGPWSRAFTWSGLIPYAIIQYFIYYLIGRRMLIEGRLYPFQTLSVQPLSPERPPQWKRWFSKFLHEDLNVTSWNIPLRQVLLKPLVDYAGLVLSWSMYTVGIFFVQSGEVNLAPVTHFTFLSMFIFYLVNTYGYILGYNLGEGIDVVLSLLEEKLSAWQRQQAQMVTIGKREYVSPLYGVLKQLSDYWQDLKYAFLWQVQFQLNRYGITRRWLLAAVSGVFCVLLVSPSWSRAMMPLEGWLGRFWFFNHEQMSEVQIAQVQHPATESKFNLPASEIVIARFPEVWQALYHGDTRTENIALESLVKEEAKNN
ncbi:MAG: hypothetical protein DSM106950_23400 [Stigonema ocellatum SAG 48.90 = DSM 106950]|nr:hypothetical protein [Stigonema ocellatum SAG 48.90 = DSM 106950]